MKTQCEREKQFVQVLQIEFNCRLKDGACVLLYAIVRDDRFPRLMMVTIVMMIIIVMMMMMMLFRYRQTSSSLIRLNI
jgi:uncharacterized protein (DUF983 family)